jgi:PAS domain S-box-containing protein
MTRTDAEEKANRDDEFSPRYAALIKNMVNAFARHRIVTDDKGNPIDYEFLEVNDSFEEMTGLKREQVLGRCVSECIPGIREDEFDWIGAYGEVALTGKSISFDQYSRSLDRWYSVAAFSPKKGEFVTIFTEITEHVKTEEHLRTTLEELERLDRAYRVLSRGNQTMLKAQEEGRLLNDICQVLVETGGYPLAWIGYLDANQKQAVIPKAVCGKDYGFVEQTISVMTRDLGETPCGRTLKTGEVSVHRESHNRPSFWWGRVMKQHGFESVTSFPLRVAGSITGFLSIYSHEPGAFETEEVAVLEELSRDLSYGIEMVRTREERNGLQREMDRKSVFLEAILNSTQDGVLVVNNEREVLYTNNRFLELWKIPRSIAESADDYELISHVRDQLINPDEFEERITDMMRSTESSVDVLRFKDGRVFNRASQPLLHQGETMGRVWSFTDVTPIARAKSRAELYLDLLTHDIRNAMQGISLGTNLIDIAEDDQGLVDSAVEQIKEATDRCTRLISKAQSIKGIEDEPLRRVSLSQAVRECTEALRAEWRDTNVSLDISDDSATIVADSYLNRLIMNLMENAVEHNDRESREVYVGLEALGPGFELSVADNGPGIPPHRRQDLLDPDRRYGGVGLHIVSQIVEKYGGQMTIDDRRKDEPSAGSEVRVWIPSAM